MIASNPPPPAPPARPRQRTLSEDEKKAAFHKMLAGCALSLLLIIPTAAWNGFAIKTLWAWFVVPLHVASLTLWQAAGIAALTTLLVTDPTRMKDPRLNPLIAAFVFPALMLVAGSLYHWLGG